MVNIPFHQAHITDQEIQAVSDTLRSGWLTMGPKTVEFEKQFARYLDVPHAVSVNSATAALHLALKAIGLKAGDEVIVPTNTFVATAEVVTYFDAKPVLCDIESVTYNIDPKKIEALITKKTKAIIPVHFAGIPCDMTAIGAIAKQYKLYVIEDAAHALPAVYQEKKIGTISDMTCFSFYATKTLSTGEGGMVCTANEEFARSVRINRLHGISRDAWDRYSEHGSWFYEVVDNGCKYNMTDIQAALGLVQLEKLEWMWQRRQAIAKCYQAAFDRAGIQTLSVPKDRESAWHLFVILVPNRDEVIEQLKSDGIGVSVHFIPVHRQPYYQKRYGYKILDYPIAERYFKKTLSLPIYPGMTEAQIQYVIDRVCARMK